MGFPSRSAFSQPRSLFFFDVQSLTALRKLCSWCFSASAPIYLYVSLKTLSLPEQGVPRT